MAAKTLAILACVLAASSAAPMRLKLLDNTATNGAICLDGTPGGYYYDPGTGADANNWIIFFQGGGWCYSEYDCWGRSKTDLGSSKHWGNTTNLDGLMSDNCNTNPTFCKYNRVQLNYCDGNSFSGNRATSLVVNNDPLYFRGHQILQATIAELVNLFGLGKAQQVMLSGCSAGGLSTYLHADYVGELLSQVAPGVTNYGAVPVSGFFLNHDNVDGIPVYANQIQRIYALSNATDGLNSNCIANTPVQDQWQCNFARYSYMYTKSRIFVLDSALDSWQTGCILTSEPVVDPKSTNNGNCSAAPGWAPCSNNVEQCNSTLIDTMIAYERSFLGNVQSTATYGKAGNGAFIYSCHTHCAGVTSLYNSVHINGVTMEQAISAWWTGSPTAPSASNIHLPCIYNGGNVTPRRCNPTCPLS